MSYLEERKRLSPVSVGTVVAIHVVIGYAFIHGLAYRILHEPPVVTNARLIPADQPPPAKMPPPPKVLRERLPDRPVTERIVDLPTTDVRPVFVDVTPARPDLSRADDVVSPPSPPARPSQSRGPVATSGRAGWVTAEDYPPQALRQGAEGTVAIEVAIGADGRVGACSVTAGSGSDLLDQATCRIYTRRARFTPALDDAGHPVASRRADRVTWRIPR